MQNNREKRKSELRSGMVRGSASGEYGEDKAQRLEREHAKRKKIRRLIAIGLILAVAIIAAATFLVYRYKPYDTYELKWDKELSEGSFAGYEQLGDYVLKYSHDGASCLDKTGTQLWVDSYEMNNPGAYVAGNYACIYDVQGSMIRIYGSGGQVGSATTLIPIVKAAVSEAGNCAAILEDRDASYINFYKKDGTKQDISIKTLLSGDGYPIDLSLSPEGTQLITTFAYLDGGVLKSKVVFYDFSEIGKNIPNRLVGGFEEPFQDSLVARVRFINSTYSYAVSDGGIYFFSSKNLSSPELVKSIPTQEHIESIFNFRNHVGVIYSDLMKEAEPDTEPEMVPDSEHRYRLVVYEDNGSIALEQTFDFDFESVSSDGTNIYFLAGDTCNIMNMKGIIKYSGPIAEPARLVVKGNVPGTFIFCGSNYMKEYQFK